MSWFSLIVGILKLANQLVGWLERRRQFNAGERAAIQRQLRAISDKVREAEEIDEEVNGMKPHAVDAALEEWYRD